MVSQHHAPGCSVWLSLSSQSGGAENRTRVQRSPPSESTCVAASLAPGLAPGWFAPGRSVKRRRPRRRLVRFNLARRPRAQTAGQLNCVTSRSARLSNLRRDAHWLTLIRQQGPILDYWQLCFPMLFHELHRVSPTRIRTMSMTPVETFRPRVLSHSTVF